MIQTKEHFNWNTIKRRTTIIFIDRDEVYGERSLIAMIPENENQINTHTILLKGIEINQCPSF